MKEDNQKIKYFLYARKSSESEDRQVQSIDDQINRLKDLANSLGLEIKHIYTEAKTAKKPNNRPVFSEMLARIEKGDASGILCWQINRLSRNPVDSGAISWMLQQDILKCIQTIDRKYLPDDNVLLFNVESGMANQFIIDLRKNSRRGMEGHADRGWLPSRPPLGYLNNKLEHIVVDDPERFNPVRRMWDMMLTGNYTPPQIWKIANDDWGFKTVKYKRSGGAKMTKSVIYKLFNNIFYTGMFQWSGKLYKGNHTPMITLEEYDRVQVILGKRGKPRSKDHFFAFTGVIRCECGGMITASEKIKIIKKTGEIKTYIYYHCTKKKKGKPCLLQKPLALDELENQIEMDIEGKTIIPEFQQWALEILGKRNDTEITDRTKIYEMQHQSVVETQKELDSLTRMRYRELIDDTTFIKERDILTTSIIKLKEKLRETENRAERWIELTEKTFHFATYARKAFLNGSLDQKREILTALGWNFSIKGKKLTISTHEWFVPIENNYPELEKEYQRLELDKTLTITERNEAFASLRLRWQPHGESNPDSILEKDVS